MTDEEYIELERLYDETSIVNALGGLLREMVKKIESIEGIKNDQRRI